MPVACRAKLPLAMISIALVAALPGCGRPRTNASDDKLHVALNEYRLNPESARVGPGVVMILVHNYGRLTHNLVVSSNGQTIGATGPLSPGQSAELDLNLAVGRYVMASTILSDEALGAYGTLNVK